MSVPRPTDLANYAQPILLPPVGELAIHTDDEQQEKDKLVGRLVKALGGNKLMRAGYERGLRKLTLSELKQHRDAVRTATKESDFKRLAGAVLSVIFAACIGSYAYDLRSLRIDVHRHGTTVHKGKSPLSTAAAAWLCSTPAPAPYASASRIISAWRQGRRG